MKLNIFDKFAKEKSNASMVEYGVTLIFIIAIGVTAMNVLDSTMLAGLDGACGAINETTFGIGC